MRSRMAADAFLVAGDGGGGATALFDGVAVEATGASVRIAVATSPLYLGCAFATS